MQIQAQAPTQEMENFKFARLLRLHFLRVIGVTQTQGEKCSFHVSRDEIKMASSITSDEKISESVKKYPAAINERTHIFTKQK